MKRRDEDRTAPNAGAIRRDYDDLWDGFARRLRDGESADPLGLGPGSMRRGVGAVVRLTNGVAASLEEVARILAGLVDEEVVPSGTRDLHTTVHALEVRGDGEILNAVAQRFVETALAIAPRHDRLCIRYEGLTVGPTGVLAQGWPAGEGLQDLRREMARRLGAQDLPAAAESGKVRRTAHATLLAFVEPLRGAPTRLADFVGSNRGTAYGTATFASMEVVRYDVAGSRAKLIPLSRIPLGNRGAS